MTKIGETNKEMTRCYTDSVVKSCIHPEYLRASGRRVVKLDDQKFEVDANLEFRGNCGNKEKILKLKILQQGVEILNFEVKRGIVIPLYHFVFGRKAKRIL
jgi:hypothetical protein